MNHRLLPHLVLACSLAAPAAAGAGPAHPLLAENCTKCHGGAKQKAGLDLRSIESALDGGESGPAIVPQQPGDSLLIKVLAADADPHMPPKKQLTPEQIDTLRTWVAHLGTEGGAAKHEPAQPTKIHVPGGTDPALAVDLFVSARWQEAGVSPAGRVHDERFVRRAYLDLVGRIPTDTERDTFLAARESDKRSALIDHLTEEPEHAAHLAEVFNVAFLGREDGKKRKRDQRKRWLEYLRWVFETNRAWDQVGRDLLLARPGSDRERGAAWFLYEQRDDHQLMATRASAALLGKQVQCAQCHDHPVAPEIEQRHYWGLVSFFSRSINVDTPAGPGVAERANGGYAKFSNLEGESHETELVMLSGETIDEPGGRREQDARELYNVAPPAQWFRKLKKDEKLKKKLDQLPVPKFSRRAEFAELATRDNPDFARATVNRLWAIVFGRGLVHPVDQMDSAHPPSHPQLLDWLARDFSANGYDVRRTIRALMKTRAYQLDSRVPGDGLPPLDSLFARALDKPLSGEVLYRSMRVAAGHGTGADDSMRDAFVRIFPDMFAETYSPSVQQAMFITNGRIIDQLLSGNSPIIKRLSELPDANAITDEAFVQILGRHPRDDEEKKSAKFLTETSPDKIRQLCWALLASAEFRINH